MKVLITGATGLVGSELTSLCRSRGIAVNYLSTSKDKLVTEETYKGFYWNPDSQEIDMECLNGVSAIINLAGASISKRWTSEHKRKVLSSRINTLKTLHKALKRIDTTNISSFVSASAIGIYPDSLSEYYEEDDNRVDDSFLGDVVAAWEQEADTFTGFGFPVAKIRIGLVMSKEGGALPEMAKPIKYYVGAAFGSGQQWQSWIHIHDLARIFLFVVENTLEGVYNGVGPNPVTNNKLIKEIAKVLKKPLFLPNIPQFVLKTILGEMSYILFASQRVSSKKIEEEGFVFDHQNICKALENLYSEPGTTENDTTIYRKEYI
ncbi:TIGR01777 family protein [Flavobacteriaceae bacterium TP-CH-4]|uniref:TIGR01777 family protein n=1 Tax=Pelagihabitans pacificus TaxID=2696054 RepID=A0A967E4U9_9FLAO|nr:TIGR01777 family oxidoreductase [Pelagihabitans pacificus]NHF57900.1 TIGR01777 family protein [Pelagihabitans pacificus]